LKGETAFRRKEHLFLSIGLSIGGIIWALHWVQDMDDTQALVVLEGGGSCT